LVTRGGWRARRLGAGGRAANGLRSGFARVAVPFVFAFVFAAALLGAGASRAQEVRVDVSPGPYYQGQPIELRVVATQFAEDPTPAVEFEPAPGASIRFLGVSPSTSTSISIINGRMSRVHEVSFVYRYELSSAKVGALRVPAFQVRQGATVRRTEPVVLEVASVPQSDEFGISVVMPEGAVFVGQKVPVVIELRIDQSILQDYLSYRVHVPLFDLPGLRFLDQNPQQTNNQLEIETASGLLRLPAFSEERSIGGRSSLVLRAERTLVAQRPGTFRVDAPTASIERATRYRRDVWGQRVAISTQRLASNGRPMRLEVAELPATGRPPSFAGAVGSGFSLEVGADRSVVQLGEPIELTFHVRGQGDLSSAGLPPLDAEGLLDPKQFRLPDESPPGILDADGKHFKVTLRVLDASVREIPALAYTWFDAQTRRFETTHSQPIALSVGAASIVGAESVTSAPGAAEDPLARASSAQGAGSGATADATGAGGAGADWGDGGADGSGTRFSSLAESAANLAVERDPALLLGVARARQGAGLATWSLYGVGLALLGLGLVERRRRAVDPRVRERLAALARTRQAIDAALAPGHADGAGALGRALRELVAAAPDEASPGLDGLLAECDAFRFAPGAGTGSGTGADGATGGATGSAKGGVPAALAERARRWIEDRERAVAVSARGGSASSAARVLALGLALAAHAAGPTPAHAAETDAAARLDRALADYAAAQAETDRDARLAGFQRAEGGFASLIADGAESPGLYSNLGNAALQSGHVGQAVLAYHRALRLDPAAATARQNLAHVRSQLPAWVPRPSGGDSSDALHVYRRVPAATRSLAAAGCFAVAALCLVVSGRRREGAWRGLAILAGVAWLSLLASVVLDERGERSRVAVITADETPARSADSALAPLAFPDPLPDGVEVERLELRGDFARVRLANGRDVWVRSSSVTPVEG